MLSDLLGKQIGLAIVAQSGSGKAPHLKISVRVGAESPIFGISKNVVPTPAEMLIFDDFRVISKV